MGNAFDTCIFTDYSSSGVESEIAANIVEVVSRFGFKFDGCWGTFEPVMPIVGNVQFRPTW